MLETTSGFKNTEGHLNHNDEEKKMRIPKPDTYILGRDSRICGAAAQAPFRRLEFPGAIA